MKKFEFTGAWHSKLKLPILSLFDYKGYCTPRPQPPFIPLDICGIDGLIYPTTAQLDAIDCILNNELDIFKAIIKVFQEKIIPLWEEADVILENLETEEAIIHFLRLECIRVSLTSVKGLSITQYEFSFDLEIVSELNMSFLGKNFICEGYDLPFLKEEYDKKEWNGFDPLSILI